MFVSKKQRKVLSDIKTLIEWKGRNIWFVQCEIPDLTMHTIIAFKERGVLEETDNPFGVKAYRWAGQELE